MVITHEVFTGIYNYDDKIYNKLFDGINTIGGLCNRIDKISAEYLKYGYKDKEHRNIIETGSDKMKGDIFEIFAECFFLLIGVHSTIGVYNYEIIPSSDDNGVDAIGIGVDKKPLTVQVKYRSDGSYELHQEDLGQFAFQSIVKYGVSKDTKINMVVFTSAKGLHYHTHNKVFLERIRTIGIKDIKKHIDGNGAFWLSLNNLIFNTIVQKYPKHISDNYIHII